MKFSFDCENINKEDKQTTINLHVMTRRQKITYDRLYVNLVSLDNGYVSNILIENVDKYYRPISAASKDASVCIGSDTFVMKIDNLSLSIELNEKDVTSIKSLIRDLTNYFKSFRVDYIDVIYNEDGESNEIKMNRILDLTYYYGSDGIRFKINFNNYNLEKWPVDDVYVPDMKKLIKMKLKPNSDDPPSEELSSEEQPFCKFIMNYSLKNNRAYIKVPTTTGYYDVKLGGSYAEIVKNKFDSLINHYKKMDML